ncbi:p091 [Rhizobium phage 16-3]|uniref:exonuclease n=1 Tax=Rhizobium phage 16-3 TaxID=10704 RepID=UPI00017BA654|nr:exonuclease [Rhizobium phage 16-3]ABF71339.1 p091 [Rhizobium phage 16-3]
MRMRPAPAIATVADDFNPLAVKGHNQPPPSPFDLIRQEIEDLYDEAKNWADGEAITSQEMHDAIERLRESLHDAGKRADALRVEEKRPLDEQIKAIQDAYNPLIQPKRGKVDLAKSTLDALLTPWRTRIAQEKAAEAARVAAAAEAARVAATEAIRASSGNLAEREAAEELLADAKRLEKTAKRADKAATTGTGLRTVWKAELVDEAAALDWFYGERPDAFRELIQSLADESVRRGVRKVPGFVVSYEKVAA